MARVSTVWNVGVAALGGSRGRRRAAPRHGHARWRRHLLAGRTAERGRSLRARQADAGRDDCRRDASRHERPVAGARIRRRRLSRRSTASRTSSNFADQRVYRLAPGQDPQPITPQGAWFYADFALDARRQRLICVREDHTGPGEAVNTLVSIPVGPAEAGHYDCWSGPRVGLRLLLDAATEPGRLDSWRGSRGAIRTCRGTGANCGSPT